MSRTTPPRRFVSRSSAILIAIAAGSILTGCVTGVRKQDPIYQCFELYQRGVFTEESLRCFPDLQDRLREPLCRAQPGDQSALIALGFGIGAPVYGQTVEDPLETVKGSVVANRVDPERYHDWKARSCQDISFPSALAATPAEAAALFEPIYRSLPESLYGPWRACVESMMEVSGPEPKEPVEPPRPPDLHPRGVRCALLGSHDTGGDGETVRFEAAYRPNSDAAILGVLDVVTHLRRDLEIEGLDCKKVWRKGSLVPLNGRVLECRRRGRSAVTIRLETRAGTCERTLPELDEEPWRNLCSVPIVGGAASGNPDSNARTLRD